MTRVFLHWSSSECVAVPVGPTVYRCTECGTPTDLYGVHTDSTLTSCGWEGA